MIALGRFFFRFREALFPAILLFVVLFCTPRHVMGDPAVDRMADVVGMAIAFAGLAVRAITIGYEYIVRGGRNKQVYADTLVRGGVYAHVRNPMYVGNALIAIGCAVIIHAPQFYLVALPLTALAYASIIAAEEAYLRDKFGAEFDRYCDEVNRIVPRLSGFAASTEGMRFNWRRLVVKEYNTIFVAVLGIVALTFWDDYCIEGRQALPTIEHAIEFLIPWTAIYAVIWTLKKTRRLSADAS